MATNVMVTGAAAENSADQVVTEPVTVCLKAATNTAKVLILLKDDQGGYQPIGLLTAENPARVIAGPGTYRFSRAAGGECGVFLA